MCLHPISADKNVHKYISSKLCFTPDIKSKYFRIGECVGIGQTTVVVSRVADPQVKILLLVFRSEIKIDLTLKKSNFLFLLCFKNAIIKFIPMHQQS